MIWNFVSKIVLEIITSIVVELLVAAIYSVANSYRRGRVINFV